MKVITFGLQKGGTGKTSISVSTAAQLAIDGKKTLFIDADPQGNATGWMIKELNYELADILFKKVSVKDAIHKTGIENLFMIPTAGLGGDLRLYGQKQASEEPFAIRKLLKQFEELEFEFVIIDTSPAFSPLESQCYVASDEVIPVLQLDVFSSDGLSIFKNLLEKLKDDKESEKPALKRIIFNAKDDRLPQQKTLLEQYQKQSIDNELIPVDQAFKKCQGAGLFIQEYAKTKPETMEAIKKLAETIKGE